MITKEAPAIRDMPAEERPVERLLSRGATSLSSADLLTMLLGGRRMDVGARLLAAFRGLAGVANASVREMQEALSITSAQAARVLAAIELGRRVSASAYGSRPVMRTPEDVDYFMRPKIALLDQEHLVVLLLNTKQEVVGEEWVYKGTVNTASVRVAEVLRPAVRANAPGIVVVHNHPSGDPEPSPADEVVTMRIGCACRDLDIEMHDHVVIGARGFVSLKRRRGSLMPATP